MGREREPDMFGRGFRAELKFPSFIVFPWYLRPQSHLGVMLCSAKRNEEDEWEA